MCLVLAGEWQSSTSAPTRCGSPCRGQGEVRLGVWPIPISWCTSLIRTMRYNILVTIFPAGWAAYCLILNAHSPDDPIRN